MGMNGGIHDAFNLGEKITQIVQDGADLDRMLDLYDLQRRKICIDFIQSRTDENKRLMETKNASLQQARQQKLQAIANDRSLERAYLMESSMINALRQSSGIGLDSGVGA
jgi:3-(3-hydroxy-phenyl)propionate hydroxylase